MELKIEKIDGHFIINGRSYFSSFDLMVRRIQGMWDIPDPKKYCCYEDCDQDLEIIDGKPGIYCEGHRKELKSQGII